MKKSIFKQTWAIVAMVLAGTISGLLVISYAQWWGALVNVTNAVWQAVSQATVNAITYRVPIWIVVIATTLVALTWYATRKISRAPKVSTPNSLTYRQDVFDGVICRWDYMRTPGRSAYQIRHIRCFCQHCDFAIGTPNDHVQECPSCSKRTVKCEAPPFLSGDALTYGRAIKGYQTRNSEMLFEDFIREEIQRRVRTDEWQRSSNA